MADYSIAKQEYDAMVAKEKRDQKAAAKVLNEVSDRRIQIGDSGNTNSVAGFANQWITTTPNIWPQPTTFQFPKEPEVKKKDVCDHCEGNGRAPKEELVISVFHEKGDTKKATRIFLGPFEITNAVGVFVDNGTIDPTSIDVRFDKTRVEFYDESILEPALSSTKATEEVYVGATSKEEAKKAVVDKVRADYAERLKLFNELRLQGNDDLVDAHNRQAHL